MQTHKQKLLILAVALASLLTTTSCITLKEENFFFPEKHGYLPDRTMGEITRKNISLIASGSVTLSGMLVRHENSNDFLIYFYGNGLSVYEIQKRLYYISRQYKINVVCFDYRGYGFSEGKPSFENLLSDALLIYDYTKKTYNPRKILIFTQSIGTVPGLNIARQKKISGIIMEAPFTNAKEGVERMTEFLIPPFRWMIYLRADKKLVKAEPQPEQMIKKIKAPLLILHGTDDGTFPQDIGKKMYEAAGSEEKTFCSLPGTGHSNVDLKASPAKEAIDKFFKKHR